MLGFELSPPLSHYEEVLIFFAPNMKALLYIWCTCKSNKSIVERLKISEVRKGK